MNLSVVKNISTLADADYKLLNFLRPFALVPRKMRFIYLSLRCGCPVDTSAKQKHRPSRRRDRRKVRGNPFSFKRGITDSFVLRTQNDIPFSYCNHRGMRSKPSSCHCEHRKVRGNPFPFSKNKDFLRSCRAAD